MGFEIDFLPVGDGEKSGDAICLRYGDLFGRRNDQTVVVIDGGYKESAENLVQHVLKYYNTDKVDLVVSTHPDLDHVSGLTVVLEELTVDELWMHRPWNKDSEVRSYLSHRASAISKPKLQKALDMACELERIATRKGIEIREPFTGLSTDDRVLCVVGPSEEFYAALLPEFRGQPKAESAARAFIREATDFIARVAERFDFETLTDDGETSAENESSSPLKKSAVVGLGS